MEENLKPFVRHGTKEERIKVSADEILNAIAEGRDIDIQYAIIDGNLDIKEQEDELRRGEDGRLVIKGDIGIANSEIPGNADLRMTRFGGSVNFGETTFKEGVYFDEAIFGGDAMFAGASFEGPVSFAGVSFEEVAWFTGASFGGLAYFTNATFGSMASFFRARFADTAGFFRSRFGNEADFNRTSFRRVDFRGANSDRWLTSMKPASVELISEKSASKWQPISGRRALR